MLYLLDLFIHCNTFFDLHRAFCLLWCNYFIPAWGQQCVWQGTHVESVRQICSGWLSLWALKPKQCRSLSCTHELCCQHQLATSLERIPSMSLPCLYVFYYIWIITFYKDVIWKQAKNILFGLIRKRGTSAVNNCEKYQISLLHASDAHAIRFFIKMRMWPHNCYFFLSELVAVDEI